MAVPRYVPDRYQLAICFNLPGKAGRHYNLCVRYELAICYNCLVDDKGVLLKSVCRGMCLTGMGGGEVFYSVALLAGTLAGISEFCPKIVNLFFIIYQRKKNQYVNIMLGIPETVEAQPGLYGQLSCLHSFKIFLPIKPSYTSN